MGIAYTEQQQSVIDIRGRNVLVSAAAGSGKTAVLVERVIQMILKKEIGIDELLVVTFTRAAASEMRERISDALSRELSGKPQPELREQLALLPSADITTIHSFCLKVIRENYSALGLEPDFRIAEEAEIEILAEEAMAELLEAEYQKAEPEFLHVARSFMTDTGDLPLENALRRIYSAAQGMAWPSLWLEAAAANLEAATAEELKKTPLFSMLWQETAEKLVAAEREAELLTDWIASPELQAYAEQGEYFRELIRQAGSHIAAEDYDALFLLLRNYSPPVMPRVRKGIDPQTLEEVKEKIESLRGIFADLLPFFQNSLAKNIEITQGMHRIVKEMCRLTKLYEQGFQEKKQQKKMIDFNDIEHMALKLLQAEDGSRTEIARRYQQKYREVIIDEYQDTNEVQDTVLEMVSGAPEQPNCFMVGDIKQSIYKFRQAKPEIFRQKYLNYGGMETLYAKIDMQVNFRSRQEILRLVNFIFRSIMTKDAAGIDYDERAKFIFPQSVQAEEKHRPELLLIEKQSYQDAEESVEREALEAEAIALQIVALLESEKTIFDKKTNRQRPIQLEDIAILMRSPSGAMSVYAEVFLRHGLPILVDEGKAYFMTSEVQGMTDFFKILDNPRDDIALLGVLCSAMYELEPEDLARIRSAALQEEFLFDALRQYSLAFLENAKNGEMSTEREVFSTKTLSRVNRFLREYQELKEEVPFLSLGRIFDKIEEKTGYEALIALLPNGKQRRLNLKAFKEQLLLFEAGEGSNLFRFLQRLEKVKSLSLSFGEPVMEVSRAIRLMSIHKSKGLEFPAVFLAQLGKGFNLRDTSAPVVLKNEYGVLSSVVDYQRRVIYEGFQKPVVKMLLRREILEEEQRLLYVAMTRAREYLYLVGTVNSAEKAMLKWQADSAVQGAYQTDGLWGAICTRQYLLSARSYLDFLMPAALKAADYDLLSIQWLRRETEQEVTEEAEPREEAEERSLAERLLESDKMALEPISFYPEYPYPELIQQKITTSASEQKKAFIPEEDVYIGTAAGAEGALRGTAYHKVLALLPADMSVQRLPELFLGLRNEGKMTETELEYVDRKEIEGFLQSSLWKRMQKAAQRGRLKKEQPFILGIPLTSGALTEQKMLQGVIDVFFEEDGELVLLDYKTDRVGGTLERAEQLLRERYGEQMAIYKKALESSSGMAVKEVWLYSLYRDRAILMDEG